MREEAFGEVKGWSGGGIRARGGGFSILFLLCRCLYKWPNVDSLINETC